MGIFVPVFHAAIFALPVCCLSWVFDKWGARTFVASCLSTRAVHELVRLDLTNGESSCIDFSYVLVYSVSVSVSGFYGELLISRRVLDFHWMPKYSFSD